MSPERKILFTKDMNPDVTTRKAHNMEVPNSVLSKIGKMMRMRCVLNPCFMSISLFLYVGRHPIHTTFPSFPL